MTREETWLLAHEVRAEVLCQVRRTTDPFTAEDAVAEAVARCLAANVRTRREMFGWLLMTARNVARDAAAKGRNRADAERRDAARALAPPEPGEVVADAEAREREALRVSRVLLLLPARQRAALRMRLADEAPVEAVAAALGTSYASAESLLSRARATFRAAWPSAPVLAAFAALRRAARTVARPAVVTVSGAAVLAAILLPAEPRPPRAVPRPPDAARPVPRRVTPNGARPPELPPTPPATPRTRRTASVAPASPPPAPSIPSLADAKMSGNRHAKEESLLVTVRRCLDDALAPLLAPPGKDGCAGTA